MNNRIAIICIIFTLLAVVIPGIFLNMNTLNYRKTVRSMKVSSINLLKIPDRTYTGSSRAALLYAKVEVTVEDHEIVKIVLLEHMYGKGGSAERIIRRVIDEQSLDVDIIKGAEGSSKVILKAIENAL